ncbi:MAG TPA: hypothetical protein PK706_25745 [Xanthobacteraceae bacterium]|nr:hypothetical protein [Xanthobacteraceae bacterium]
MRVSIRQRFDRWDSTLPSQKLDEVPNAPPSTLRTRCDELASLAPDRTPTIMSGVLVDDHIVDIDRPSSRNAKPGREMLGLGSIRLGRSLRELQAIDPIEIIGEVPWQIVDPVVDIDVALIFQEADEAPDPRCNVRLINWLLRRIPVATAPMLLEPPDSPIVDRADRGPMPFQPMQEMADRRAIQNRTA